MKKKAIIVSIKGYKLSTKERKLLSKERPWGLILFKRNIKTLNQIQNLIKSIKKYTKDKKFPILIDEEGAEVSRLSKIFNHNTNANLFGSLYEKNKQFAISLYKLYLINLCSTLRKIGVNINTIPVLDVLRKSTHSIIGKRSFSKKKEIIKHLGKITVKVTTVF